MFGVGGNVEHVGLAAAEAVGDIEAAAGAAERKARLRVRREAISRADGRAENAARRGVGPSRRVAIDTAVAAIGRSPDIPARLERRRATIARRHRGISILR